MWNMLIIGVGAIFGGIGFGWCVVEIFNELVNHKR